MPPRKQQIELPDEVTEHAPDTLMGLDEQSDAPDMKTALPADTLRRLTAATPDYRRLALEWAVKIAPPNVLASEVISNAVLFERFLKGDNG